MTFDLYNPTKMISVEGYVRKNTQEFKKLGEPCLIVTNDQEAKRSGALDGFSTNIAVFDTDRIIT